MILMILRRSQRAKTIAVPFFTPSLAAFGSVWDALIMIINVYVSIPLTPPPFPLADTQHNRLIYHAAEDVSVSLRGV